MHINVDPRLFLSSQPSSLPPVPADWYREQTPSQLSETEKKAADYLVKALSLRFGSVSLAMPELKFQPLDGATNNPLTPESSEVHLLATAKGLVPADQNSFELVLGHDAMVSLILMNSFQGEMERRPSVLFPGETSRPFPLPFQARTEEPKAVPAVELAAQEAQQRQLSTFGWGTYALPANLAVLILAAAVWVLRKKKNRGRI